MEQTSVVRALWRRFRGLAGGVQLVIAVVAALVLVSPFTSDDDRQTVAATAPTSTTAPAPAGGGCHPSYSGACVPAGVSDVDCAGGTGDGPAYVSAKRFSV